jgi:hypothetical protein
MPHCGLPFAQDSWRCSWSIERGSGEGLTRRKPMRSMPVLDGYETAALEVAAAPAG